MKVEDLSGKTVAELRAVAKSRGLSGYSRLRKSELLYLLTGEAGPARDDGAGADASPRIPVAGRVALSKVLGVEPAVPSVSDGRDEPSDARPRPTEVPGARPRGARRVKGTQQLFSHRLRRLPQGNRHRTEQKIKSSKYFLGIPEEPRLEERFEYPESYGENVIALMVRDPYWLFSYWEFAPNLFAELATRIGEEKLQASKLVLRVYDVTGADPDSPLSYHDIDVAPGARNWYINVMRVERDYCVDIGILSPDGTFITIARSNVATLPPVSASGWIEEELAAVEVLEQLYKTRVGGPSSGSGGWGSGGWGL
jgi:hypothetical protein